MALPLSPHGLCECQSGIGGGCCHGRGPAAYSVARDGEALRVCTRCDLSSDTDKRLLVTFEDDADVFFEFDPLGFLCIALDLKEKKGEDDTSKKKE